MFMLHIPLYLHPLPTNLEGLMKPDFSDYIIAVLFELNDGLPHSMDWCVDRILDRCSIEYEIPLVGHYLKKEDVYYTSVKTTIVMLEANGIVKIDNDHNAMLTRKGKRYIEMNELEIMERWKELHDRKVLEDKRKNEDSF